MVDKAGRENRVARSEAAGRGSLRLWISFAVVLLILFAIGLGQWDFALAGAIGLILGNGLRVLVFGR